MNNHQKRVAVFLPALYGGGAERTMLNLAQGIAECGYAVDLVLAQAEGPYMTEISDLVHLVDLGQGKILNRNRTLSRLPALVRYLRTEKPDAVVSALRRTNLVAVWAQRLAGGPRRVVVNEQSNVSVEVANLSNSLMRLWPYLAKRYYPWADKVVGVSQGVVDDLVTSVGIPQHKAKVIYNPVITAKLREKARAPLEHPWFQSGEPPVILAVGRLMKQKDFSTLLKAFAELRQHRQARLLILGEGDERPMLEALASKLGIQDDVSLPGFADNPYPFMRDASLFVMSSRWEGLPTVLIEVLYCGTPIVSTDCPNGPREILSNGTYGRLVSMENPKEMAAAMAATLDSNDSIPSPESWQPYTVETVANQYIELLFGE